MALEIEATRNIYVLNVSLTTVVRHSTAMDTALDKFGVTFPKQCIDMALEIVATLL